MKIAFILFTNGLEYDDRIRKEMFSIKELVQNVEIKVFALHADNHSESGVLSYGVPYELVSLKRRGGSKGILSMIRKEYDFYSQIKPKVKDFDLLWVCDHQPFLFPLLSKMPIIWDLHEIPTTIIGSFIRNLLFHCMEKNCKWLIHANQERVNYLIQQDVLRIPSKNFVLRNYPDKSWLNAAADKSESFVKFKEWLGGNDYVYLQGINSNARYPWETLSAIMNVKRIKAVVIGNFSEEMKNKVLEVYPDASDYIYYVGQVVQSETSAFIYHSKLSMVFYSVDASNNRYCEPNRMFQCLGMGKPVIVGCNEPMRNVIEKFENGIVLSYDGRNIEENEKALAELLDKYDIYKQKAECHSGVFTWESQSSIIGKVLK